MIPAKASRILVVEDEALILMATLDMLRELGHEAIPARCGEAAIAAFEQHAPIDVLLTDVNLPDFDGQVLAEELRSRSPGLSVIFATGYRLIVAEAVARGGPTAILGKPFRTSDLADALSRVQRKPTVDA